MSAEEFVLIYRHKKHDHGLALARVDLGVHVAIFYGESRRDVELAGLNYKSLARTPLEPLELYHFSCNAFIPRIDAKVILEFSGKSPPLYFTGCSQFRFINRR